MRLLVQEIRLGAEDDFKKPGKDLGQKPVLTCSIFRKKFWIQQQSS